MNKCYQQLCDQVLDLTNYIELGFEMGQKTGVVFLDLSVAYDTVWKCGLMFKLSLIIPCQKTLSVIMDMLSDRNFQVEINEKGSRKRVLNNGLPQDVYLQVSCTVSTQWTYQLRTQENSSMLTTTHWPTNQKRSKS